MGFSFCGVVMSIYVDNKYIRLISGRLRNFKQKKDDLYNFSCPICGDSQKNKLKARGYVFRKGNDLFFSCHNCGVGLSLGKLLERVDPSLHSEYVMERYVSGEVGQRKSTSTPKFNITPPKFDKVKKENYLDFSDWCDKLDEQNICKVYLESRKIPVEHYGRLLYTKHYKKFLDHLVPNHDKKVEDDERLVIPFYNQYNEIIAVSGRALTATSEKLRYVTVRTNDSKEKLIYGLERLDKTKPVKIVEGPLDSLFLSNCIASGDSNLSIAAKTLGLNNVVLIFDNEPRNKEIVKMIKTAIDQKYSVVIWPDNIKEKDVNDMVISGLNVEQIIEENTFRDLEALVKLTFWKKV